MTIIKDLNNNVLTLPAILAQLDELYDIRYSLNEQLNIIKDRNDNPKNRTFINAITALLIYHDLIDAQSQIEKLGAQKNFVEMFCEEGD